LGAAVWLFQEKERNVAEEAATRRGSVVTRRGSVVTRPASGSENCGPGSPGAPKRPRFPCASGRTQPAPRASGAVRGSEARSARQSAPRSRAAPLRSPPSPAPTPPRLLCRQRTAARQSAKSPREMAQVLLLPHHTGLMSARVGGLGVGRPVRACARRRSRSTSRRFSRAGAERRGAACTFAAQVPDGGPGGGGGGWGGGGRRQEREGKRERRERESAEGGEGEEGKRERGERIG
jgi:hypothetical protein